MASPSHGNNQQSNFDMRQPEETWKNFNRLAVWTLASCLVLVVFMAIFLTGGHPPKPM
jgi:hypothetical protein